MQTNTPIHDARLKIGPSPIMTMLLIAVTITVTGVTVPLSAKTCVIPTFLPISPSIIVLSLCAGGSGRRVRRLRVLGRRADAVQQSACGELDASIAQLYVSARRLPGDEGLEELGRLVTEVLKDAGVKTRTQGRRTPMQWWELLIEDLIKTPFALVIDDTGEKLLMGSTTGSLWISEDQGELWEQISAHLPPVYCVSFVDLD